jgi:hypothetical protein
LDEQALHLHINRKGIFRKWQSAERVHKEREQRSNLWAVAWQGIMNYFTPRFLLARFSSSLYLRIPETVLPYS